MSRLLSILQKPIVSNSSVVYALQFICFAMTVVVFLFGMQASARLAATPGEVLAGVLGTSTVALGLTILGLLLPKTVATLDR